MAIFLLISIGSVSASDDVAADSDVLASADESVVLTNDIEEVSDDAVLSEETPEKTNTTVTATSDKEKFGYDDEKNITVTVKDNKSNPISGINASNLTVHEGKTTVNFTYNNSMISILDKLAVGTHNLTINYKGNDNYNSSTTSFLLKIYGNKTLEDVPAIVDTNGTTVEIPFTITDGVENFTETDSSKFNITDSENNQVSFNIDGSKLIINNIAVPQTLTINYTDNGASSVKKVQVKYKTNVTIVPTLIEINEGDNATFTITVYGADGQKNQYHKN
jgi:hypothetical protein